MDFPVAQPVPLPKIIGHRGVAGHAPENTLAAFRAASLMGLTWVEFDVMLSGFAFFVLGGHLRNLRSGRQSSDGAPPDQ